MPLNTEIIRNGKNVSPTGEGWNGIDLNAMYSVAFADAKPEVVLADNGQTMGEIVENGQMLDFFTMGLPYLLYGSDLAKNVPLIENGNQTLENDYSFDDGKKELTFKKGDILKAWRT